MKKSTAVIAVTLIGYILAVPAHCEDDHAGHTHAGHAHDTSGIEMGLSAGYVHLKGESEDAPGLHVHLSKRLGQDGVFEHLSLGIGGEAIFADHEHYALMLPLSVYPWRGLVFSFAPSIVWAEHEGEWESEYATHLEAAYVFEIGDYDMGPVIGYSKTSDEEHYMIGVHIGLHL